MVYSGGQIVPQQPQVVVQQILQGPVVQHQVTWLTLIDT